MRYPRQAWRGVRGVWTRLLMVAFIVASCERQPASGPMVLNDFESRADLDRIAWRCRTTFALTEAYRSHGQSGLLMTLYPDPYPGLSLLLTPAQRQWQGYRFLALELFNPGSDTLALHYRIDDREAPDHAERVNGSVIVQPGRNRVRLDLAELRTSGSKRALAWERISALVIFLISPARPVVLGVDHVRLERGD